MDEAMLVICEGQWTQVAGAPSCDGVLTSVSVNELPVSWLPALTYGEANTILAAIAALWALVWVYRQLGAFINDQKPD